MEDVVVFWRPGIGRHCYVAYVQGDWYEWPAWQDGWLERRVLDVSALPDNLPRLEPPLARLALRLSGVGP
jgi:hypothetical protein